MGSYENGMANGKMETIDQSPYNLLFGRHLGAKSFHLRLALPVQKGLTHGKTQMSLIHEADS